jgi:hypothetical protein
VSYFADDKLLIVKYYFNFRLQVCFSYYRIRIFCKVFGVEIFVSRCALELVPFFCFFFLGSTGSELLRVQVEAHKGGREFYFKYH